MKIFITSHIPSLSLSLFDKYPNISIDYNNNDIPLCEEELIKRSKGCSGILCTLNDKINSIVIEALKDNLKVISTMSVGYDHIDINTCKKYSIKVGHTPGVLTDSTAELTISLLLSTIKRIPEASNAVKNGSWGCWKTEWMLGKDISNSIIGIIGFGLIGKAVAKRLVPFQCKKIIIYQPRKPLEEELNLGYGVFAEYVSFDNLLKESDIISVHCPLTKDTNNLFNDETFNKMKNGSVFINTSRGGVVNQDSLYKALTNGPLFAAGLDVTTPEPLPIDNPLLKLDNCLILPHIGSASTNTRNNMSILAVKNILEGINGKTLVHEVI